MSAAAGGHSDELLRGGDAFASAALRQRRDGGVGGLGTPAYLHYPSAERLPVVDSFHGGARKAEDPYRWLEDVDSVDAQRFVAAQNRCSQAYLDECELIPRIEGRMRELYDYEKFGLPFKRGQRYFFHHNNGLQQQYVLMKQDGLDGDAVPLLDPNAMSKDGTAALRAYDISPDGKYLAYGFSYGGSDWFTIRVRDVETCKDVEGCVIEWCKFSDIEWLQDSSGFFYGCYEKPGSLGSGDAQTAAGTEVDAAANQMIRFHRIGTATEEDTLVYRNLEEPKWMFSTTVTDDGHYLLLTTNDSCDPVNRLYFHDLESGKRDGDIVSVVKLIDNLEAEYSYIANEGLSFYFKTNLNAPKYRVIRIDFPEDAGSMSREELDAAVAASMTEIVAETSDVLESAICTNGDVLLLCYLQDCKNVLVVSKLQSGKVRGSIPLPGVGSVTGVTGRRRDSVSFFKFASFLLPGTTYRIDWTSGGLDPVVFRETKVPGFDASKFEAKQVFVPSKDGTVKIPMFIVSRRGKSQVKSSALLYGYGGFSISLSPYFSPLRLPFIDEMGGIFCIANLRGGGEYGEEWHKAGTKEKKQNVFDDFISCGEYLVSEGYTTKEKLCIMGGSNGGLLVGACCNQRPDLFGAVVAQVGVMDMLRFHKFTIGYAWCSDFGNAEDDVESFDYLRAYSPLHNVKAPSKGVQYPAMLLLTADHDDRVVPLHTFKLLAELQHTVGRGCPHQTNPILGKISVKAGHGAGKPTDKVLREYSEIYGFIAKATAATWSS